MDSTPHGAESQKHGFSKITEVLSYGPFRPPEMCAIVCLCLMMDSGILSASYALFADAWAVMVACGFVKCMLAVGALVCLRYSFVKYREKTGGLILVVTAIAFGGPFATFWPLENRYGQEWLVHRIRAALPASEQMAKGLAEELFPLRDQGTKPEDKWDRQFVIADEKSFVESWKQKMRGWSTPLQTIKSDELYLAGRAFIADPEGKFICSRVKAGSPPSMPVSIRVEGQCLPPDRETIVAKGKGLGNSIRVHLPSRRAEWRVWLQQPGGLKSPLLVEGHAWFRVQAAHLAPSNTFSYESRNAKSQTLGILFLPNGYEGWKPATTELLESTLAFSRDTLIFHLILGYLVIGGGTALILKRAHDKRLI
jgi:hypothetical protein